MNAADVAAELVALAMQGWRTPRMHINTEPERTEARLRDALAAVIPQIQVLALEEFAAGLPRDWQRPNGPADAARAHAAHLLECTCTTQEPTA